MDVRIASVRAASAPGRVSGGLVPALLCAALVVGCTGDVAPLEEAIEVRDLGIVGLSIVRPDGVLRPTVINPGERLRFTLEGRDANGGRVEVGELGRAWRVSDPNVATIDANGELVGLADGDVAVDIRIGDVVASAVDVSVSRSSVAAINRVVGPDGLDPCVPARYVAIGGFADGTERLLSDVDWSVGTGSAELAFGDDGSVTLFSDTPGTLPLVAGVNEAMLEQPIAVADSLTALAVGPSTLAVEVDETLDLIATGTYTAAAGGSRTETVTGSVDWGVTEGAAFATISDEAASRGRVSGESAGLARVQASCGAVASDIRPLTVFEDSSTDGSSDDDGLSFEDADNPGDDGDGGTLSVSLRSEGSGVQLRVSTGSSYDDDDEVTGQVEWSTADTGDAITVGVVSTTGFFTPLAVGVVEVRATLGADTSVLTVNVTAN